MTIHPDHTAAILAHLAARPGWHTTATIAAAVAPGTDLRAFTLTLLHLAHTGRCLSQVPGKGATRYAAKGAPLSSCLHAEIADASLAFLEGVSVEGRSAEWLAKREARMAALRGTAAKGTQR